MQVETQENTMEGGVRQCKAPPLFIHPPPTEEVVTAAVEKMMNPTTLWEWYLEWYDNPSPLRNGFIPTIR